MDNLRTHHRGHPNYKSINYKYNHWKIILINIPSDYIHTTTFFSLSRAQQKFSPVVKDAIFFSGTSRHHQTTKRVVKLYWIP